MKRRLIILAFLVFTITLLVLHSVSQIQTNKSASSENINKSNEVKEINPNVEYTHPSGKFSYTYPASWEFVPKREDIGLRPLEYSGPLKNEIVTIIYFEEKGKDLKAWAKTFDGGYDEDWIEKTVFNKKALYYNYNSDKLDNMIYYFSNGTDAVKVMFRKYYALGVEGQRDNSRFLEDFELILKSFKFN